MRFRLLVLIAALSSLAAQHIGIGVRLPVYPAGNLEMGQAELLAMGMTAWYRADIGVNGAGMPADGAAVDTWADQSGNGYDLSDGTGSPTFFRDANNGRPAITVDGLANGKYDFQSNAAIFPSLWDASGDGTVIMAVKTPAAHEAAAYRYLFRGTAANVHYQYYAPATSGSWSVTHDGVTYKSVQKSITLDTWQILLWQRDADTTLYSGVDNLATVSLATITTLVGAGGNLAGSLQVGFVANANATTAFGLIQEVIFFSTSLTEAQRLRVQQHLER